MNYFSQDLSSKEFLQTEVCTPELVDNPRLECERAFALLTAFSARLFVTVVTHFDALHERTVEQTEVCTPELVGNPRLECEL